MLYPVDNQSRETKDLCGIWDFKVDRKTVGRTEKWFKGKLKNSIMIQDSLILLSFSWKRCCGSFMKSSKSL